MVQQIGGNHYQADYQHWDWCIDLGLGYLESAATKYVTRCYKKNGVQDVEKAITYLEKAQEARSQGRYSNQSMGTRGMASQDKALRLTRKFCNSADLDHLQSEFIERVQDWRTIEDLSGAIAIARLIIASAQTPQEAASVAPAPLPPASRAGAVSDALRRVSNAPQTRPCPVCNGAGYPPQGECSICDGSGIVPTTEHPSPFGYTPED